MTDKLPSGHAYKQAGRENETFRNRVNNAKANKAAQQNHVYGSELDAAGLIAEHARLKREFYERNPERRP